MLDIALERDNAPGQPENDQEHCRGQPKVQVQLQNEHPHETIDASRGPIVQHELESNQQVVPMNNTFAISVLCLTSIAALNAQQPSASVVGRITDASGAVIPGVTVKFINLDTNISRTGSSNEAGDFTVPYLNPGRYSMEAAH